MKFYGLRNKCSFSFRNVVKLYGLRNDACFEGFEGSKQGSRTDRKYSQTKLGYDIMQEHLKSQLVLQNNGLFCDGDFFHVCCPTHVLKLIVQEGLKLCSKALEKN